MATTTKMEREGSPGPPEYSTGFSDGLIVGVTGVTAVGFWAFTALLIGVHPFVTLEMTYTHKLLPPIASAVFASLFGTALFAYALTKVEDAGST